MRKLPMHAQNIGQPIVRPVTTIASETTHNVRQASLNTKKVLRFRYLLQKNITAHEYFLPKIATNIIPTPAYNRPFLLKLF
jgi:hypothetical protein